MEEKLKKYKFRRSFGYIFRRWCLLFLSFGAQLTYLWVGNNLDKSPFLRSNGRFVLFVIISLGLVQFFALWGAFRKQIQYTLIEPGKITIKYVFGKTVLKDVVKIEHVTRMFLRGEYVYVLDADPEDDSSMQQGSAANEDYNNHFTRICVNYKELAFVTLANGKKYLINYPQELLTKEAIAQVVNKTSQS